MAFQLASKKYSATYGYPKRTMSVFVEDAVIDHYGSIGEWWESTNPGSNYGVVRVPAGVFRVEGQIQLMQDDLLGLVGHGVGWAGGSMKQAKRAQQPLAQAAQWVINPVQTVETSGGPERA